MLRAVVVVWRDYSYLPSETVATTQIIFFSSDSRGNWRSWSISAFLLSLLWLWKNATRLCLSSKPLSSFSRCRNMADPLLIPENQMIWVMKLSLKELCDLNNCRNSIYMDLNCIICIVFYASCSMHHVLCIMFYAL